MFQIFERLQDPADVNILECGLAEKKISWTFWLFDYIVVNILYLPLVKKN